MVESKAMDAVEATDEPGAPKAGLEAWLRSPWRVALLILVAAAAATLATSLGEMELRRASGLASDADDVLWLQGALWLGWAVLAAPLAALAGRLAGNLPNGALALAAHVPLAVAVGCGFLAAEIRLQEAIQGPEETANAAELIRVQAERNARAASGEAPPEGRRRPRGGPRGDREGPPRADGTSTDADGGGPRRGRRRPSSGMRRLMFRAFNGSTANVATGDLGADFERRWLLRVPRYVLVYFAVVGLGLGMRSFLVARTREREARALELRAARLREELSSARLDALRGQLHPHFLFNALHSVGGLIRTERRDEALTALDSIGDLLRTSLDAETATFVPLAREVELSQGYLAVERLRLGERLQVAVDVPQELAEAEVPAFITQPLTENAVKHGVARRVEGGSVTIRAAARGEQLVIEIVDRGRGAPVAPDPSSRGGVGLDNVRGRLEALFPGAASLELVPEEDGMRAVLTLPLDSTE